MPVKEVKPLALERGVSEPDRVRVKPPSFKVAPAPIVTVLVAVVSPKRVLVAAPVMLNAE